MRVDETWGSREGVCFCRDEWVRAATPGPREGKASLKSRDDVWTLGGTHEVPPPTALSLLRPQDGRYKSRLAGLALGHHPVSAFAGGSVVKKPPAYAGDANLIPESRRSPGEGNSSPLQYSCLGNPADRGAWWATVHVVTEESDTA